MIFIGQIHSFCILIALLNFVKEIGLIVEIGSLL